MIEGSETVKELLSRAIKPENLYAYQRYALEDGPEQDTQVYSIPGDEFSDYLLRIPRAVKDIKKQLETTTLLYPAYLCDRNFGQILLSSCPEFGHQNLRENFQIISKVCGISLDDIFWKRYVIYNTESRLSQKDKEKMAWVDVLKILSDLPASSFEALMKDINYLTERGMTADIHWGNILLDGDKLRIIDVHCDSELESRQLKPADNNLDNLKERLLHPQSIVRLEDTPEEPDELVGFLCQELEKAGESAGVTLLKALEEKLEVAASNPAVHFPRNEQEASIIAKLSPDAFKAIEHIGTALGSALHMNATTQELGGMLKEIKPRDSLRGR